MRAAAVLSAACLLFVGAWAKTATAQRVTLTPEQVLSLRALRSPSGRFTAVGTNAVQMLDLLKWADNVALVLDRTLRLKPPENRPVIRITLAADSAGAGSRVSASRTPSGWVLTVVNYEAADVQAATRTLAQVLLDEFLGATGGATNPVPSAPTWFLTGVVRNMDAGQRERDFDEVLQTWSAGGLPSLAETFASSGGASGDAALERSPARGSVLVRWLLSVEPPEQGIGLAIGRLASGRALDISVLLNIMRRESVADLEAAWDDWLLNRRWHIGTPGRSTAWIVERIRAERLIYGGDSGMPERSQDGRPLSFADLVRLRKTRWAAKVASAKAVSLRVHAAGRGREVESVVDAYCRFLDAVRDGRSEAELERLLGAADRALDGLESALKENPDEGQKDVGGQGARRRPYVHGRP